MKFVGRERELKKLNELYEEQGFQFIVIYGRRRVGKTMLINEFLKEKRSVYYMSVEGTAKENLSGISEVDALVDFMQKKRNTEKLENGGIPPNIEEMLKAFALRVETLTPSERMVLQYYVDGYTIQEIASLLYISIGTARKHNTNMNRKLGITVREELMLYIELFRKCNQLDKLTYSRTE